MASAITQDKIIEINEAYLVIKTYAGVARKVGVCAGTVKKYIIDGYVSQVNLKTEKKDIEIPPLNAAFFESETNLGNLCILSDEEKSEIEKLWQEILI